LSDKFSIFFRPLPPEAENIEIKKFNLLIFNTLPLGLGAKVLKITND
jgi:hypothetical protein